MLAEGWYEDGVFHVDAFGLPPPEAAKTTRFGFLMIHRNYALMIYLIKFVSSLRIEHFPPK